MKLWAVAVALPLLCSAIAEGEQGGIKTRRRYTSGIAKRSALISATANFKEILMG